MKNSVILLSGGMDSATALYEFKDTIALAVGFSYGSKHNKKEQVAAEQLACNLGIPYQLITLDFNTMGFKSDLLQSGGEVPEGHYADPVMKRTVVPFRNGIMLAIATGIAESNGLTRVIISNHNGDHAVYPDCRLEFIENMNEAVMAGTYSKTSIFAPYTLISKADIAHRGRTIGVPYELTWSCYKGGENHCGKCGTCYERKEALGGFDLTEYEN